MEREIDLNQISDGKRYTANDMVKAGCGDCVDCSLCCREMGKSIILDPYDIFNLEKGMEISFEKLLEKQIELNVVDGIIQPNLKMQGAAKSCGFLSMQGRCSIHDFRPGFCRMFPLGRVYGENDFRYFLQIHECPYPNKTKIKVKKWLGIPDLLEYEAYIRKWHYFFKDMQKIVKETQSDIIIKNLNMYLLNQFYVKPYDTIRQGGKAADFYGQFYERFQEAEIIARTYK